jgi:lysyl endopeptidase
VHFDRLALLPGDHVTVSDAHGTEVQRIEAGLLDAPGARKWAMSVDGDTAVVTLHRARPELLAGLESLAGLGVEVDRVAHGLAPGERTAAGPGREESVCGRSDAKDAVCYKSADPVAYNRSKAVARLLINGVELCTGWRLGPTNRMLTNNHCMVSSADAYDTEVWFDYQCAQCGGHAVFKPTKVWGGQVLSTYRDYDYTLFTVENFEKVQKFGYLTIDPARPAKGTEVYIPQHPGGDPGVIAMTSDRDPRGNCAIADPAYDGYAADSDVSYHCDTAGGSSGSPVLSRASDKVVGLHHFGGCPNSGVRIDLVYNRIKRYL